MINIHQNQKERNMYKKANKILKNQNIDKDTVFLDIETTGFSAEKDRIIGFSLCKYYGENCGMLYQNFFADEKILISEFFNLILGKEKIITFSGENFEKKFIRFKLAKYKNQSKEFEKFSELFDQMIFTDLQEQCRCFAKYFDFKNFSRSEIEKNLNLQKSELYDMKNIISSVRKKDDKEIKSKLISHSYEEIITMIGIYDKLNEFKNNHRIKLDENMSNIDISFILEKYQVENEKLTLIFTGSQKYKLACYSLQNGDSLRLKNDYMEMSLYVSNISYNEKTALVYELEDGYLPLIISGDIIYENIAYLLQKYKQHLIPASAKQ